MTISTVNLPLLGHTPSLELDLFFDLPSGEYGFASIHTDGNEPGLPYTVMLYQDHLSIHDFHDNERRIRFYDETKTYSSSYSDLFQAMEAAFYFWLVSIPSWDSIIPALDCTEQEAVHYMKEHHLSYVIRYYRREL